jgi:sigma-B regulation protein RsbU (phosphoserine phosphatase)
VQKAIWRLRNRLIVAYGFVAVVPTILILGLIALVAWTVIGQVAVYIVTSQIEQATNSVQSSLEYAARFDRQAGTQWLLGAGPILRERLPGLEICLRDGAAGADWKFPKDSSLEPPPSQWGDASGILAKDGLLYGWARVTRDSNSLTAVFPLTAAFLQTVAPDLGEVRFLSFRGDNRRPEAEPVRLHPSPSPNAARLPFNRVPPPVNMFDLEVLWPGLIPVYQWNNPRVTESQIVRIRTRPSAVLGTLFAQKVDIAENIIPLLFLIGVGGFLLAEITSVVIGISITRTITGAVHNLYEGTERVMEGDFSHRIDVKGHDQLAALGSSFNRMTENLERLLAVAKESERVQAELEIAREVQRELYPKAVPKLRQFGVVARCNPARMVSGDYYDYQLLDENLLALAIGDVAGKGISAALLMATVQSAMRSQIRSCSELAAQAGGPALHSQLSTSRLVSNLNQHLYAHTSPEKFATFFFGLYDEETSVLTYTNAGHLPPLLVRHGAVEELEVNGMVVGAFPFARYGESQIRLETGDLLVFYTDGITEPENAYGEMFGERRLIELVSKNVSRPSSEIVSTVLDAVREWTGSPELQDDQTLVVCRRE